MGVTMFCRSKPVKPSCKHEKYIIDDLEDSGREQFFWHYSKSKLPIRDIIRKTEPHIEVGAENYLKPFI